jgi:S-adenosylmethionine:tRNA ribosyltransferase-isomerase
MQIHDFDYELPPELIAQEPLARRDASRLLVLDRASGSIDHARFIDLPQYLRRGDLLVANNTRVIPARLLGTKKTGGRVEVFLVRCLHNLSGSEQLWECLLKFRRTLPVPSSLQLSAALRADVLERTAGNLWHVMLRSTGSIDQALLESGRMPLPPYIRRAADASDAHDRERYQTVFAEHDGAVAAPTAGLHFTPALIDRVEKAGAACACITLHVGYGTFQPVRVDTIEHHRMHPERYHVTPETAHAVTATLHGSGRVIAVGTTATRTLEAVTSAGRTAAAGSGYTDLYIYPGYRFKAVDALITNFHLPRSSLLLLVAAFAGRELVLQAYQEAVRRRYRFFSYGDAMLIL